MVEEDEFYAKAEKTASPADVIPPHVVAGLKEKRDEFNHLYSQLILNPYLGPQLIPDLRSTIMSTIALLMENGIPVSTDPKIRSPNDVINEGLAELGGMVGGRLVGGLMKMKQGFENSLKSNEGEDDFIVYRDPDTGTYYYVDDNGYEIDCDQHGNPIED